jgi:hypothetical protein
MVLNTVRIGGIRNPFDDNKIWRKWQALSGGFCCCRNYSHSHRNSHGRGRGIHLLRCHSTLRALKALKYALEKMHENRVSAPQHRITILVSVKFHDLGEFDKISSKYYVRHWLSFPKSIVTNARTLSQGVGL